MAGRAKDRGIMKEVALWSCAFAAMAFPASVQSRVLSDQPQMVMTNGSARKSPDSEARAQEARIQAIMAKPASVDPFAWAEVAAALFAKGDRERAAFWYYLFQIRSKPWRITAQDPSGYPALYGSISYVVGQPINEWAGSDPEAWKALVQRAISYERRLPLSEQRPKWVSEAEWHKLNETSRQEYANGFLGVLDQPEAIREGRRKNGLPVGPWYNPGAPLPDDWR